MSSYPNDPPDWYWKNGLHDACITGAELFDFPYDYYKYDGEKCKGYRNLFALQIDASNALYESDVKEIRFFNCKVLTDEITLQGRRKVWWLADRLTQSNDCCILEIDLQDFDSFPEEFTFRIKFSYAEVDRL